MHAERALVVGHGRMGRIHARVLRDLGYHVTTVDPDPRAGADHAALSDLPNLGRCGFRVAAVATPIPDLLDAAFELAGTPMLVEKPFAPTVAQAKLLAAHLQRNGAPVCVGYVERFNPRIRELDCFTIHAAVFTRHNDRPSPDPALDLLTHDVDLAHHLGIDLDACTFDVKDNQPARARRIELVTSDRQFTVDLMDHDQSPLHALWHAFLTGKPVPGPADAIRALEHLEQRARPELPAAA